MRYGRGSKQAEMIIGHRVPAGQCDRQQRRRAWLTSADLVDGCETFLLANRLCSRRRSGTGGGVSFPVQKPNNFLTPSVRRSSVIAVPEMNRPSGGPRYSGSETRQKNPRPVRSAEDTTRLH